MTLTRKLMLTAELWGMEASCDFEHLYTMPILQNLGMPLSLVSLTGLMAGVGSMLLLPLLGWLTDRGSNPQRRKAAAIFVAAGLIILGMGFLIMANLMHLSYLLEWKAENSDTRVHATTTLLVTASEAAGSDGSESSTAAYSTVVSGTTTILPEQPSEVQVPFKAGMGMLSFVLTGMGFYSMNSVVRSYALALSPSSEHTSLLVVGLIMASSGGVSTAALGVVDFSSLFGLSYIKGGSLNIQTSVQALAVILFVLMGLPVTMLAGRRQQKRNNQQYEPLIDDEDHTSNADSNYDPCNPQQQEDQLSRSATRDAFENSIRSFGAGPVHFDHTLVLLAEDQTTAAEQASLLHEDSGPQAEFYISHATSMTVSYGASGSSFVSSDQQRTLVKKPLEDIPEGKVLNITRETETCQQCCGSGYKTKIVFISLACFFSVGVIAMFTLTTSDYVGKAIYGGDPYAVAGSDALLRYQEGVRTASRGFLVYFLSYLCISLIQSRLLALIGRRVEFVLVTMLMGMAMLILSFLPKLEAFFFLTVVAGIQRACFHAVPFTVASDVLQAMASKDGKANVGFAMSVVTASMPLGYCTLFPWVTAVEDYTGVLSVPLWLGSGFSCLAVISFLLIGKV